MNDSDFLSFFPEPEEDAAAALNSEELALLFNEINGESKNNGDRAVSNENQSLDDFGAMLGGIEMLEEMLLETEMAGEVASQEMTELEQETSVMFEGDDLEWENLQEEDSIPMVSLVPPLLQSYQTLQTQVANLSQRLAETEQELIARQRRTSSAESLIEQQAIALTQAQEQLAHTVAELQIYRETCKHQQLQVETLTEQLATREEQVVALQHQIQEELEVKDQQGDLQAQIVKLTAETERLQKQISYQAGEEARFEKHLDELRTRLQRQQRYALQYKSALEQCLAQPDFRPSSDISQAVASLTGQSKELKPWTSVGDILAAFPSKPISPPVADLTPGLTNFSPSSADAVTESMDSPQPEVAEANLTTETVEESATSPAPEPSAIPTIPVGQKSESRRSAIDTLSFTVREQKPSRRNIDLPSFLPRSTPIA